MDLHIDVDDPRREDVAALLGRHLDFAHEVTPAGHVHALDVDRLVDPTVTFFSARVEGTILGVGALRRLDPTHAELKSMHTTAAARGQGVGRAILARLLNEAAERGFARISLETGTADEFLPARTLYASVGFERCRAFGDYTDNPHSVCMTMKLATD